MDANSAAVSLPVEQHEAAAAAESNAAKDASSEEASKSVSSHTLDVESVTSTQQQPSQEPTPATPTTPASVIRSRANTATSTTPASTSTAKTITRVAVPALPVVPALPKASPKQAKAPRVEKPATGDVPPVAGTDNAPTDNATTTTVPESEAAEAVASPPVKAPPSSWANLFARPAAAVSGKAIDPNGTVTGGNVNGSGAEAVNGAANGTATNFAKASSGSVAEAVQAYRFGGIEEVPFLEPRGLINTGNMCYMNSVSESVLLSVVRAFY